MNILIIGSGAREHAVAKALQRSPQKPDLYCFGNNLNPGIKNLTQDYFVGSILDIGLIVKKAEAWHIDFVIIGPEAPLEKGLTDALWLANIPVIGPNKKLAQIETSKAFARYLLQKYKIPGLPRFKIFNELEGINDFLNALGEGNYVVKADGLMSGKGVKVAGDHLFSIKEAYQFCEELIKKNQTIVIEEKLVGQEFSLLCFTDGKTLIPMPLVQDHKRAFIGDTGPNTGGMGSYSASDHSLPFLTATDITKAYKINEAVISALSEEFNQPYMGILYGSFIATRDGIKVIEFNARFGDPEAINVLAILETDLVAIFQAILRQELNQANVRFANLATVCKYVVPNGYPDNPLKNSFIDISAVNNKEQLYFAAIDELAGNLIATGSRAIAVLGIDENLFAAEKKVAIEIQKIKGQIFHRPDIGTKELIDRRIASMKKLRHSPKRLGVLGSTRGTHLLNLIEAIQQKKLAATIEIVISNKSNALILERAATHGLRHQFLDSTNLSRDEYDQKISAELEKHQVELIVLIGYMRILSRSFVKQWAGKIINVHPSLLPAFAGGMDQNVHDAVLKSGVTESGCTIHQVTEEVDAGPILIQKKCDVTRDDTIATLKKKVQTLEGEALIEVIQFYE